MGRYPERKEINARNIALTALEKKYGSLEAAFESLLNSGVPSLVMYAYQMGFGKPQENAKIEVTHNQVQTVQVIQLPHNERDIIDITPLQTTDGATNTSDQTPGGLPANSIE
jgi:hypothetical protein